MMNSRICLKTVLFKKWHSLEQTFIKSYHTKLLSRLTINLNKQFKSNYTTENIKEKSGDQENFFGFETVSHDEKRERVQSVFTSVAENYDLMNDVMSVGIHRYWKDYFIDVLSPTSPTKLLDVAGGTGDIAIRFLQKLSQEFPEENLPNVFDEAEKDIRKNNDLISHVTVLDINEHMLEICKKRVHDLGLSCGMTCVHGTAEDLPFPDNTFDAYTIAFGIRNVALIDQALSEAYRVLKPGGRFLCLEFSQVQNPLISRFYDLYSFQVIPCLGQIIARDWKSYQYLVESIRKFPNQKDFSYKIEDAGFDLVTHENLLNGIAAIHSGFKV